jgi:lipoprotein-anchoring transpeptidase ErfK/SrfK
MKMMMTWKKVGVLVFCLFLLTVMAAPASAQEQEACGESHKVVRGDTLNKIAKRCGVTLSLLLMANPQIKNPSRIYPGQVVELPRRAEVVDESSGTVVVRPEKDRITPEQILELGVEADEHWIDVDLSSQTVSAFQGGEEVRTFLASSGTWRHPTVTGQFAIYQKFETKDMRGPGYFLRDVPYTMFFHKDYGLHGTYWHSNFGTPMSHGCINLNTEDAAWLYEFAAEGTLVNVRH